MYNYKVINKKLFNIIYFIIKKWNKYDKNDINNCCKLKKFIIYIFTKIDITYNTLCLSLYYLFEIKRKIEIMICNNEYINSFLSCGRRMFITTLIISNKVLKIKCYKNISKFIK